MNTLADKRIDQMKVIGMLIGILLCGTQVAFNLDILLRAHKALQLRRFCFNCITSDEDLMCLMPSTVFNVFSVHV